MCTRYTRQCVLYTPTMAVFDRNDLRSPLLIKGSTMYGRSSMMVIPSTGITLGWLKFFILSNSSINSCSPSSSLESPTKQIRIQRVSEQIGHFSWDTNILCSTHILFHKYCIQFTLSWVSKCWVWFTHSYRRDQLANFVNESIALLLLNVLLYYYEITYSNKPHNDLANGIFVVAVFTELTQIITN